MSMGSAWIVTVVGLCVFGVFLQIIITLLLSSVGLGQIVVGPLTDRRRPALLVGSAL